MRKRLFQFMLPLSLSFSVTQAHGGGHQEKVEVAVSNFSKTLEEIFTRKKVDSPKKFCALFKAGFRAFTIAQLASSNAVSAFVNARDSQKHAGENWDYLENDRVNRSLIESSAKNWMAAQNSLKSTSLGQNYGGNMNIAEAALHDSLFYLVGEESKRLVFESAKERKPSIYDLYEASELAALNALSSNHNKTIESFYEAALEKVSNDPIENMKALAEIPVQFEFLSPEAAVYAAWVKLFRGELKQLFIIAKLSTAFDVSSSLLESH